MATQRHARRWSRMAKTEESSAQSRERTEIFQFESHYIVFKFKASVPTFNACTMPTFRVTGLDRPDEPLIEKTPTVCWTAVQKRINQEIERRRVAREDLPPAPKTAIAGTDLCLQQPVRGCGDRGARYGEKVYRATEADQKEVETATENTPAMSSSMTRVIGEMGTRAEFKFPASRTSCTHYPIDYPIDLRGARLRQTHHSYYFHPSFSRLTSLESRVSSRARSISHPVPIGKKNVPTRSYTHHTLIIHSYTLVDFWIHHGECQHGYVRSTLAN